MQRIYLTASLLLSLLVPVLSALLHSPENPVLGQWISPVPVREMLTTPVVMNEGADNSWSPSWLHIAMVVYAAGVAWRLYTLVREMYFIFLLNKNGRKERKKNYVLVTSERIERPFSFFNRIFIGENIDESSKEMTIRHEYAHVRGHHSWDNCLFEVIKAVLFFHPCIYLYKRYLNEVHEYLADRYVASRADRKAYAFFLLENAGQVRRQLILPLSNKLITKRILMLSKPIVHPRNFLYVLIMIPAGLLFFSACSLFEDRPPVSQEEIIEVPMFEGESAEYEGLPVRKITWNGNTLYSDDELTSLLNVREGDSFSAGKISEKLAYTSSETDFSSHYMDHGYLFFSIQPEVIPSGDGVELVFDIYEGQIMKIGTVCVKNENEELDESLVEYIKIQPGQLFDRSALIASTRSLAAATGQENITTFPTPFPEDGLVNIEFIIGPAE